jgi:hypothetical protein
MQPKYSLDARAALSIMIATLCISSSYLTTATYENAERHSEDARKCSPNSWIVALHTAVQIAQGRVNIAHGFQ